VTSSVEEARDKGYGGNELAMGLKLEMLHVLEILTDASAVRTAEVLAGAGALIEAMVSQIKKTADLVQEIDAASTEQAKGIAEDAKAIEQFDQVVQSNSSVAEQVAATNEELTD